MFKTCALSFALLLAAALSTLAQTRGTLSGYVKDSTAAVVPGVSVTLTHEQTGARRTATSDQVGFYQFLGLLSGSYTLEAEMANFKRYKTTGITLTVDQNARADIQLKIGAVAEYVEVRGAAAIVDTRSSALSSLVDDRRIVDLPLYNRNVMSFASLLPGVTQVSAPANSDVVDARGGPTMTVNGGRRNQSYTTLNGTYFANPSRNTALNVPPPDAVQEFRIKTNNYSAEEGRNSGAIVSVVTRAGGNDFHASAWQFHRSSALNARSFFEGRKPVGHQNQFGAAAGGPIRKDKLFWFASYEGIRDRRAASSVDAYPPTAAERVGNFSHLARQLTNPFASGAPFPANQIPASLIDPASQNLLSFLPTPPSSGRLTAVAPAPRNSNLLMFRHDWTISSRQTLFAHYYFNQNLYRELGLSYGSNIPDWMQRQRRARVQNAGLSHTFVFSPTLLNQITLGFTRSVSLDTPSVTRRNAELKLAGLPDYTDGGASQFRVTGRFDLRAGGPVKFISNNYDLNEAATWVRGRHTLKFGLQYLDLAFFQSFLGPPSFTFNGTRAGDTMADFLLGAYRSLTIGFGVRVNDSLSSFTAAYFQDDFKLTPRLTLNYGLRYELPLPWVDKADRIDTIDRTPGVKSKIVPNAPPGMLFVGDLPRGLYQTDKNNFAPRFGFAYDLFGHGRLALRGAYGIFYDTLNADSVAQENAPFAGNATFYNGRLANPVAGQTPPPVYPDAKNFGFVYPITGFYIDLGLRTAYIQQWNFTLEQQLTQDLSLQAAYVGKTARKLPAYRPFNAAIFKPGNDAAGKPLSTLENAVQRVPLYPGIYSPEITSLSDSFKQFYHSFQLRLTKRFSRHFTVLGSYTLGKSIDDSSTYTLGACVSNPFDFNADRGRADFDSRHALAVSWLWTPLPSRPGLLGSLFAGWTLSAIHLARSGYPVTVTNGDDIALCGACGSSQHPDLIATPTRSQASRSDMIAQFFNKAAFRFPQRGMFGSAGRGIFSGPASVGADLAALKDFRLHEQKRLQFRSEFFNIFNQVNFGGLRTTLTDSHFGQLSSAGAGRAIQFAIKFVW